MLLRKLEDSTLYWSEERSDNEPQRKEDSPSSPQTVTQSTTKGLIDKESVKERLIGCPVCQSSLYRREDIEELFISDGRKF